MGYDVILKGIVRRLQASSGRRIARRNALRELDTLLRKTRRELRKKFPAVGKDGKEVRVAGLPSGQRRCPACQLYVATAGKLAVHYLGRHNKGLYAECWCGKRMLTKHWQCLSCTSSFKNHKMWDAHAMRYHDGEGAKYTVMGNSLEATSKRGIVKLAGHFARVGDIAAHAVMGAIGERSTP